MENNEQQITFDHNSTKSKSKRPGRNCFDPSCMVILSKCRLFVAAHYILLGNIMYVFHFFGGTILNMRNFLQSHFNLCHHRKQESHIQRIIQPKLKCLSIVKPNHSQKYESMNIYFLLMKYRCVQILDISNKAIRSISNSNFQKGSKSNFTQYLFI